jgi:uncharacterized protein (TIGR02246 family)
MRRNLFVLLVGITLALTAQAQRDRGKDEAGVRNLIPKFTEAWAQSDARALGELFAPDADLVIPTGQLFSGREAIAGFYASVFAAGYKGSKGAGEVERLRFVGLDVALGDGTWSITGAHDADGREAAPERGIFTFVAIRQAGEWKISGLREQTGATRIIEK